MKLFLGLILSCFLLQTTCGQSLHQEIYASPRDFAQKLNASFEKGDQQIFESFFQSWHKWSLEKDSSAKQRTASFVDSIFQMAYQPFDYTIYSWKSNRNPKESKYLILPNLIPICIKDSIYLSSLDSLKTCGRNSKSLHYSPSLSFDSTKVIYDNPYYTSVLRIFLEEDYLDKSYFLSSWINCPPNASPKEFSSPPIIIGCQINKKVDNVVVHLKLSNTEFYLHLTKNDKTWNMEVLPYRVMHD